MVMGHHRLTNLPIAVVQQSSVARSTGRRISFRIFGELSFTKLLQHNDEFCMISYLLAGCYPFLSFLTFSHSIQVRWHSFRVSHVLYPHYLPLWYEHLSLFGFNLGTELMSIPVAVDDLN